MDKILRIDVSAEGGPKATQMPLGEYAGMGGRGMTSMVIYNEVPPDCHPLGPENKLVIAPGLMAGTAASTSGRISIGCKSPLTGGIQYAHMLANQFIVTVAKHLLKPRIGIDNNLVHGSGNLDTLRHVL